MQPSSEGKAALAVHRVNVRGPVGGEGWHAGQDGLRVGVLRESCSGMTISSDEERSIAAGASEEELLDRLGPPTERITAREQLDDYLSDEECLKKATKVLYYERWFHRDLAYGHVE